MKYMLTAVLLVSMTITPAHGQAWLGQIIAETAAQEARLREERCMQGEFSPPSERRMTSIRQGANATMSRYLALAATSESSDTTAVFSNRPARSWERRYSTGVALGAIESVNDPVARTVGAVLGEPVTLLLAGDGATAAGLWIVYNGQGKAIGHYLSVFRREHGDWRLLHLEMAEGDRAPAPLMAFCHQVGDVTPIMAAPASESPPAEPAPDQVETPTSMQ